MRFVGHRSRDINTIFGWIFLHAMPAQQDGDSDVVTDEETGPAPPGTSEGVR